MTCRTKSEILVSLGAFLFFGLCLPTWSHSAIIEGIVLCDQGRVADPKVYAYSSYQDIKSGIPSYTSTPHVKAGFFRIEVPQGTYYLTASGTFNGKEYFSFHGANPISIAKDEKQWIPFMAVPKAGGVITNSGDGGISGVVTFRGAPVKDAQVSLYYARETSFRGMGILTKTTGNDGFFRFIPEQGQYVIIARKRSDSREIRPLRKSDLFCYFPGNPVTTVPDKSVSIELPCYPKDDLGMFLDEKVYARVSAKKAEAEIERSGERTVGETPHVLLSGRVTDTEGNPLRNLYIATYRGTPFRKFQMHYVRTMPEYLARTDENGYYRIEMKEKGTFYIVAREHVGEAPLKGELYGLYEGNVCHRVDVGEESLSGVNIVAGRVMGGDGSASGAASGEPRVAKTADTALKSPAGTPLKIADTVIERDAVWEGDILIEGTVLIRKGVTLTINPGTVVKFGKVDRDHDGVGEGEIRVFGRLMAKGTPQKMIRFTSVEKKPDKKDWAYILFFASDAESVVEYCIFEHAFTGVQAHFSKVTVRDSLFRNNQEGIRFGRAEIKIEHNEITDNTYGIRHTRIEGPVEITSNIIKGNDVGIFFVPSSQNTVDFSLENYAVDPRYRMQPAITGNNIYKNREYNYKLGEREGFDVILSDNWWGSAGEADIYDMIYDKKSDSSLGRAIVTPYLTVPAKDAGARK